MHRPGMTKLAIGLFVLIVFIAFTPANQAQAFLNNAADSHIYITNSNMVIPPPKPVILSKSWGRHE